MTSPRSIRSRSEIEADDVQVPGVRAVRGVERGLDEVRDTRRAQTRGVPPSKAPGEPRSSSARSSWTSAERRRDVGHVVLVADVLDLVVPRAARGVAVPGGPADPVQRHQPGAIGDGGVVGHEHPAFAGRDRLRGIERVGADRPERSRRIDRRAADPARERVGGVLDDRDAARARARATSARSRPAARRRGRPRRPCSRRDRGQHRVRGRVQGRARRCPRGPAVRRGRRRPRRWRRTSRSGR